MSKVHQWIQLTMKDYPRTTTREQYKSVSRYLRTAARMVQAEMEKPETKAAMERAADDAMRWGSGTLFIGYDPGIERRVEVKKYNSGLVSVKNYWQNPSGPLKFRPSTENKK